MAAFYKCNVALSSKIRKRKLKGFVESALGNFFCNSDFMSSNSYVADFSFFFCLLQCFIKSSSITRAITLLDAVQLVNINVIGFKIIKRSFKI